jgi:DNA-binding beta-propeller fold protein YncE
VVLAGAGQSAPAPVRRGGTRGFLVLDNCGPEFVLKPIHEDNLSFFDAAGKLVTRISGFNNSHWGVLARPVEIGSPHKIAIDLERGFVWVVENEGDRLLRFDRKGKKQFAVQGVQASALAVDPATGNVWLTRSQGRLEVRSPAGRVLAQHEHPGWDIVYSGKDRCFWLVEKELLKVSLSGKVLARQTVTNWCASSLAVDLYTGAVWVTTRHHSGQLGRNALVGFDNQGRQRHDVALGTHIPFRVAVDSDTGAVWVTNWKRSLLKYTSAGKPDGEHRVEALAADVEPGTGCVWVATGEEVLMLGKGGKVLAQAKHKGKTRQAWVLGY